MITCFWLFIADDSVLETSQSNENQSHVEVTPRNVNSAQQERTTNSKYTNNQIDNDNTDMDDKMDVSYSEQVTKPIKRHVEETPGGRNDDDNKTTEQRLQELLNDEDVCYDIYCLIVFD